MPPKRPRAKRLRAEERRAQLLDLAAEILNEQGFDALTMEAVKERGKISRGLAYAYFANAEELVLALYEREMVELERRLEAATSQGRSYEERVAAANKTYFDFIADRDAVLPTLQNKLSGRWFEPSVRKRLARLIGFWSREIEAELGASPKVAAALARAGLAACEALAAAWRGKHLSRRDAESLSLKFVLGGTRNALG